MCLFTCDVTSGKSHFPRPCDFVYFLRLMYRGHKILYEKIFTIQHIKAYEEVTLWLRLFLVSAVDGSEWLDSHSGLFNLPEELSMPTEYEGLKFSKYEWILKLAYSLDNCPKSIGWLFSASPNQIVTEFTKEFAGLNKVLLWKWKIGQDETASFSMLTWFCKKTILSFLTWKRYLGRFRRTDTWLRPLSIGECI